MTASRDVVVRRVDAATTLPLRAAVLRAGMDPSTAAAPDDDAPDTWFFAVLGPDGGVLSTVNVRPGAPEFDADGTGWWRLRGMATAPEVRGRGHARAVVTAALGQSTPSAAASGATRECPRSASTRSSASSGSANRGSCRTPGGT